MQCRRDHEAVSRHWVISALVLGILALGLTHVGCQQPASDPQSDVVANFTSDVTEAKVETPVQFTDLSSANIKQWLWEFGDGDSSTSQNPTHSYDSPGTYTVSLTVTGDTSRHTETKPGYIRVTGASHIPSHVTGKTRAIYEWARIPEGNALLEQVPCYCGCKDMAHKHTRDCFWRDDGAFERHGMACSDCLDIAEKTKQMHEQGKDICEIRKEIDRYYAANADYGTDTPVPQGCES